MKQNPNNIFNIFSFDVDWLDDISYYDYKKQLFILDNIDLLQILYEWRKKNVCNRLFIITVKHVEPVYYYSARKITLYLYDFTVSENAIFETEEFGGINLIYVIRSNTELQSMLNKKIEEDIDNYPLSKYCFE